MAKSRRLLASQYPSAYLSDTQYENLGLEDSATRDEYFLVANAGGESSAAHYDDIATARLMFSVK